MKTYKIVKQISISTNTNWIALQFPFHHPPKVLIPELFTRVCLVVLTHFLNKLTCTRVCCDNFPSYFIFFVILIGMSMEAHI